MEIGERIKFIRGGLTQKKFGHLIGADQSTVQVWEIRNSLPKGNFLQRIHEQFGVNINWLLTGMGEPYVKEGPDDPARIEDREGLWGRTQVMDVNGESFAVTTYEPKTQGTQKQENGVAAADKEKVQEIITQDELALVRTLRRTGTEYRKRVYVAVSVRAQNKADEKKLSEKEKKRFKKDLEVLTTAAIE